MPKTIDPKDTLVDTIAEEIAEYLAVQESAADTLDGIVQWWLLRQRLQEGRRQVEAAVDLLCRKGTLKQQKLVDGTVVYLAAHKG